MIKTSQKDLIIGIFFALLWATAAIATKIGLLSASPIPLAVVRFLIAGIIMILASLIFFKEPLPKKNDWKPIAVFGFLNITIYLGCLFSAINIVSTGLSNLFISINPILIALFSDMYLKQKISTTQKFGFFTCFIGLFIATIPLLKDTSANFLGIILLIIGMCAYSFGSVYYKKINLSLSNNSINSWQTLFGGLLLVPVLFFIPSKPFIFDQNLYVSLFWLTIIISIFASLLWLNLLKKDTVKASKWLFLAPVWGYILAYFILDEPISIYAIIGTILVIAGLKISK